VVEKLDYLQELGDGTQLPKAATPQEQPEGDEQRARKLAGRETYGTAGVARAIPVAFGARASVSGRSRAGAPRAGQGLAEPFVERSPSSSIVV